eukprot:m.271375 g.271375  ORF g.271375 m.271375 type:complete len:716 (-) comp22836_c2_seq5:273-2420(-)
MTLLLQTAVPRWCRSRSRSSAGAEALRTLFAWARSAPRLAPVVRHKEQHAVRWTDEYSWLEQARVQDRQIRTHMQHENRHLQRVLKPQRQFSSTLAAEIHRRSSFRWPTPTTTYRNYMYYSDNVHGRVITCREPLQPGTGRSRQVVLQPELLARKLGGRSISGFKISPSELHVAFVLDKDGTDCFDGVVQNIDLGPESCEILKNVRSMEWTDLPDTLLYTSANELHRPNSVWAHRLGTPQSEDQLVFEEPDERFFVDVQKTKDDKYLTIYSSSKRCNAVQVIAADDPSLTLRIFHPKSDSMCFVEHVNNQFFVVTDADQCYNYKIIGVAPDGSRTEYLPHSEDVLIKDAEFFESFAAVHVREKNASRILILPLETFDKPFYIPLPEADGIGEVLQGSNLTASSTEVAFSTSTPFSPGAGWSFDFKTRKLTELFRVQIPGPSKVKDLVSHQVFAKSQHDGTLIPITVLRNGKQPKSGENPLLVIVYGCYGQHLEADFQPHLLSLLDRGWSVAKCHVRGGDDLGNKWHHAAVQRTKQLSMDDLRDCAQHLVAEKFVAPELLAGIGMSAGGMVLAATCNQNPSLFRSIVLQVPFVDVLTSMLDEDLPLTLHEQDEWGRPVQCAEDFRTIQQYCPYHNIPVSCQFPAALVQCNGNDTRVPFWQHLKYVSRLRERIGDTHGHRVLMHCSSSAGHLDVTSPTRQALEIAFLHHTLKLDSPR